MAKPTRLPTWATDGGALVADPGIAKQAQGWAVEIPAVNYENWYKNLVGQWVTYIDTELDVVKGVQLAFDAIVGANGNYASLQEAIDDLPVNSRIFVKDPATLTTKVDINKEGMEIFFHPNASYSKGPSLVTGLEISASRVKLKDGRFLNFDEVLGNAIVLTVDAKNCFVKDNTFFNNTNEIQDNGSNNVQSGNIAEVV